MITTTELKAYIKLGNNTKDSLLTSIISRVESEIKTYCQQPIDVETVTYYTGGSGSNYLLLPYTKVNSLTSLESRTEIGGSWASESGTLIENDNLYYIYLDNGFISGIGNYKVVLSVGYSTVPNDIKGVAIEMAAMMYKESAEGDNLLGVSNKTIQSSVPLTQTFMDMFERSWRRRLQPYRIKTK